MPPAWRRHGNQASGLPTAVAPENYGCRRVAARALCYAVSLFGLHRRDQRIGRRQLAPGSYLTDGQRLFRVTSLFVNGRSMLASIEDCLTLETRAYADSELGTMRLRRVRGKRAEAPASPPGSDMRRPTPAAVN